MLAYDQRQVAQGTREPEGHRLGQEVGWLAAGWHIELEVARNAGRPDRIRGHLAVGEGGNVERDLQGLSLIHI